MIRHPSYPICMAVLLPALLAPPAAGARGGRSGIVSLARMGRLTRRDLDDVEERDWAKLQGSAWSRASTGPFRILYPPGWDSPAPPVREIAALITGIHRSLEPWVLPSTRTPLRVYLDDPGAQGVSLESSSTCYKLRGAIHVTATRAELAPGGRWPVVRALRHEMTHLLTLPDLDGAPYAPWISEGLACYLEERPDLPGPREWRRRHCPAIRSWAGTWEDMDSWNGYYKTPQFPEKAASILAYLEDLHGEATFRRFIARYFFPRAPGNDPFRSTFQAPAEELEKGWVPWARGTSP